MPVTPFHFGPGAAIKAVTPKWFCLVCGMIGIAGLIAQSARANRSHAERKPS